MKTLILNGSPKAEKGNTEVFIRQFEQGYGGACRVAQVAREDPAALAASMAAYDAVLLFFPLYVYAMPGIVMRLIEQMRPAAEGQRIGFVVQYGFVEGTHAKYVKRYLELLAQRLGYGYCGTIAHGNSAGVMYMPDKMNRKLFAALRELGGSFAADGQLDAGIAEQLQRPYVLSRGKVALYRALTRIGLMDMFWNSMLKENRAYEKRYDRPFA